MRAAITILLVSSVVVLSMAQNLESIGQADPIKISGGFNATGIGYAASGINARRDPLNYFLTGNINFNIYGWSVPLTFSYSNQNASFRQPFNQYGIAPTYKWAKVYLGYHNLTYSSYTLAGHIFSGAAVELTPNKWRLNVMYGRLNQAVEEDTIRNTIPSYRRMGFAMKVGYGDNKGSVDVIMFQAKDDVGSLASAPVKSQILPGENLVLSVLGKKRIGRFSLMAEAATSAVSRNVLVEKITMDSPNLFSYVGGLFTPRASSEYFNAIKSSVGYLGKGYNVQLNYERVDPGYQTFGAYFFNNDIENITVSTSVRLLKERLDLSANVGQQRNNLKETQVNAVSRVISAFNFNYTPNQKWNVNGSYSNFTTFTRVRPRVDPFFRNDLDTLNFYQLNQNASGGVAYSFGTKENKQGMIFNGSWQDANESAQGSTPGNNSSFYTGNLAYRSTRVATNTSYTASFNYNKGEIGGVTTLSWGPNLSVTKAFLEKKLRATFTTTYNQMQQNDTPQSRVLNLRLNGTYTIQKKHLLSLNIVSLRKFAIDERTTDFNEYTATINYGYSF